MTSRIDPNGRGAMIVIRTMHPRLTILVAALAIAGCAATQHAPAPEVAAPAPFHPTVRKVVSMAEWEGADDEAEMDFTIPAFNPAMGAGPEDQIKSEFRGKDRKGAKTSVVSAHTESFDTIDDFVATLESDDTMLHHHPAIKRTTDERVAEEERNVRVHAWIYAITFEADQDWHVIAGTDPTGDPITYFNCEVSGLPAADADDFDQLLKVRKQLATILDNDLPAGGSYTLYEPFPVTIEGSIFFDVDHKAGAVGPNGPPPMKPDRAWEIHPITKLSLAEQ